MRVLAALTLLALAAGPARALDEGRVLARAICTGQGLAVETYIAETHPDLNTGLEISPQRSLRPLSLALVCLQSLRQSALPGKSRTEREAVMVERLLRLGANPVYQEPDLQQQTPLHLLFSLPLEQQAEIYELLLRFDADTDLGLSDANGKLPRDVAIQSNPALAQALIRYQPSGLSDFNIRLQPFAYAAGSQTLDLLRSQEQLLEAIAGQDSEQAAKLLEAGLSPDFYLLDPAGRPLLHQLALDQKQAWIELMLSHGASLRIRDFDQREVLHLLAASGSDGLIRLLAARGAAVNARDVQGESPLFAAVRAGRSQTVALLLELGADARLRNHQGQRALDVAQALEKADPKYRLIRELLTPKS
ncbi:MAG TPA: ankyrin repeat domain-containing protein [Candidatus Obscuribacterales bacterium]